MTQPDPPRPWGAYVALAFGIVCIGFAAIFVKMAAVPGPASAFWRVVIGGAVMVPWWLLQSGPRPARSDLWLLVGAGVFFGIDLALWNTSILWTTAATATLLANNAPLWVGLGSLLLFRERLSRRYWIGLAVALAGMGWVTGGDAFRHLRLGAGNLLAVVASLFYASYLLSIQRARRRTALPAVMGVSALASIATLLLANLVTGTPLWGYPARAWIALGLLGVISQVGGWLSITYALGHLRAAPASVCLLAQVLVTALASMPILGEYLKFNQIAGGVLVLAGIYLVTWEMGQARDPRRAG